jgi:rod shape determining protein RodA
MTLTTAINRGWDIFAKRLDPALMVAVVVLAAISLSVVYSASGGDTLDRMLGQARNFAVAFVAMWIVANTSPQTLMRFAIPLYVVGLTLLIGVALFGEIRNGSRRWLNLGFITLQPSEIMKLGLPLILAWYFHKRQEAINWRDYLLAGVILAVPSILVNRQPDLGTSILVFAAGFFVIFLSSVSWKALIGAGIAAIPFTVFAWFYLLHDYQKERVISMLDPSQDPLGAGYHVIQASIAIGSGGILGKGWLNGSQSQLDFIPERSTDFILAVYGEEFGLFGALLLITLYVIVIGRGFMIAMNAPTTFSRLLAGAITMSFFTYAFVNVGMVTGLLPVVGVPLPLMSYGGTAILSMCIGFGMLMSINSHKQLVST